MLKEIIEAMGTGGEVKYTIKRIDDGKVQVVIQSVLGEEPKDLSEAAQQARALLATPLVVSGHPSQIEEKLRENLPAYKSFRRDAESDFKALTQAAKETTKEVRSKADEERKKGGGSTAGVDTAPQPTSVKPTESKAAEADKPAGSLV